MSSIKALSRKSELKVVPEYLLTRSATAESMRPQTVIEKFRSDQNAEKTIEELLLEDILHNTVVRSSQLSPFMTKFAPRFFAAHDVAVTSKFPDKRLLKGQFHSYTKLAHRVNTARSDISRKMSVRKITADYSNRQNSDNTGFEEWMASQMPSEKGKTEIELSCRELRQKSEQNLPRKISLYYL